MAYFNNQIKTKTELQEKTNNFPLDNVHLSTMNFGEYNVAYYRHNTPREKFEADVSVFARPFPIQMPVMARAEHKLKFYYVPFRTISPQWNSFINREPHIPYNDTQVIHINEMPYFTIYDILQLLNDNEVTTTGTANNYDFLINSTDYKLLTPLGRYIVKVMQQLGYDIIWADLKNTPNPEHIDAMALLAYAKVYCDFYYNNAYFNTTADFININQLFLKDAVNAYNLTASDIKTIFKLCQKVFYSDSYVTSVWDNPNGPNNWISIESIVLKDITLQTATGYNNISNGLSTDVGDAQGTPRIHRQGSSTNLSPITQYAIDALKKMTDYCVRYAMAGVRSVDRYLARFGVLLSAEKMKRSVYYGEQITPMEFGAIYSQAATSQANIGEYAGQGIINSDGKEHKHYEIESDEYGIILGISTIIPKVNYFQGIDRNNLHHEVETYFNGVFDQLGCSAVSQAEILVSEDDNNANLQGNNVIQGIYGYLPRGYEYKIPRDRLTGDFRIHSRRNLMNTWHLFRQFNQSDFPNGIKHNVDITKFLDSQQYLRIFDNTNEEDGDHFYVIYQIKANAQAHAKPLYDTYDMESEGKEIMLNGNGPKQN